jgi:glycosyltransferase involved in cell wall biosynthesis
MVHILMISAEFSPNQPTPTRVSTLAKVFARQGHRVIILSNSGQTVKGSAMSSLLRNLVPMKAEVDGVSWIFPPVVRSSSTRGFFKALEGLLSIASTLMFGTLFLLPYEGTIDVVYSSTAQSQGIIGDLLKIILHRPLVVNYGDPAFARDTGMVRIVDGLLETIALSKSSIVIATDPVVAEYVLKECGKRAIFLPNGYDASLFRGTPDSTREPSDQKIITFVGKMDLSIYRLDIMLNALALLKDKFPTIRLRLIGSGPDMVRLKSLAMRLGVQSSVEFVGLVPHDDVPRWLSRSDVCVHITNDLCTGIKVAEYMAAKKPVVIAAPWWNRYSEFLENGVNCSMVPLIAEELAVAIADLLANPFRAASLATKGYETVSPWTWEAIAQEKMRLIMRLTK